MKIKAERKSDGKKFFPAQIALTGDLLLYAVFNEETDEWENVNHEDYELTIIESIDRKVRRT